MWRCSMIYVIAKYLQMSTGKWLDTQHEFHDKHTALRGIHALRCRGFIIQSYMCDDPMDAEWLDRRVKL